MQVLMDGTRSYQGQLYHIEVTLECNIKHTHSNIVFQGQLYQGEAKSKSWSAMCSGQVMVYLQQKGGSGGERGWQLVAFKGEDRVHSRNNLTHQHWWPSGVTLSYFTQVWEGCVDAGFKHRVRDSFVQWQQHGPRGVPETYALRLKNKAAAQQVRSRGKERCVGCTGTVFFVSLNTYTHAHQFSEAITTALTAPAPKPKPAEVHSRPVALYICCHICCQYIPVIPHQM